MIPDVESIVDVAKHLLFTCLILSLPTLLTALVVGVTISLIQTVTSIQEATLTFVPKLAAVAAVVAMVLPWLIDCISAYFEDCLQMFSSYY